MRYSTWTFFGVAIAVFGSLVPDSALAGDWGEYWGTMIWQSSAPAVPVIGLFGTTLLVGGLFAVAWRGLCGTAERGVCAEATPESSSDTPPTGEVEALRREVEELRAEMAHWRRERGSARIARWLARPGVRAAIFVCFVVVPLTAYAVTVPNTFVNGTVADADQVNANFLALEGAINLHEPDPAAHHAKTTDASELTSGILPDARLASDVSRLGTDIDESELAYDPATQAELAAHTVFAGAHHLPYTDALAIAAVGPHVTSIDGLSGGTIAGAIVATGGLTTGAGLAFPDGSVQTTAATNFQTRVVVAPSGGDYTTIAAALAAITPTASAPVEITIAPGTYDEALVLKSYVTLRGAGQGSTILTLTSPAVAHLDANLLVGVTLRDLTLRGSGPGGADTGLRLIRTEITLRDVEVDSYGVEAIRAVGSSTVRGQRVRVIDAPNYFADRGAWIDNSDVRFVDSEFDTRDCAIEATDSRVVVSASTVGRVLCASATSASADHVLTVGSSRIDLVDLSGQVAAEIVGNHIEGDASGNGGVQTSSTETVVIVGNSLISEDGPPASLEGPVVLSGNHIVSRQPSVSGVFSNDLARITGNSIEVAGPSAGIVALGTAQIIGNDVLGTTVADPINASASSLVLGNRVATAAGDTEVWRVGAVDIEATSGDVSLAAGGSTITIASNGNIAVTAGAADSITFGAGGSTLSLTASGDVTISAADDVSITAGDDIFTTGAGTLVATAGAGLDANVTGAVTVDSTSFMRFDADTSMNLLGVSQIDLTTPGTVDVNGGLIELN